MKMSVHLTVEEDDGVKHHLYFNKEEGEAPHFISLGDEQLLARRLSLAALLAENKLKDDEVLHNFKQ